MEVPPLIKKEELLKVIKEIVKKEGLDKINIRLIAKECNVSVGSVYNYFPSKVDLVFELVESYWKEVIDDDFMKAIENLNFINFIEFVYQHFDCRFKDFTKDFLNQISSFNHQAKAKGKNIETKFLENLKLFFLKNLEKDSSIKTIVWTDEFSKQDFIDFVFINIIYALKQGQPNCKFLLTIIKKIIY